MSNKLARKLRNITIGSAMDHVYKILNILLWKLTSPRFLLVHTPKCAGTYLHRQYNIHRNWHIKSVGHAHFRSLELYPKTQVVGLIREPMDWYASYYFFCKNNLSKNKQSIYNFPAQHPISIFSKNSDTTLEQMIFNMTNQEFLENILMTAMTGNIYGRNVDDIFDFMKRTKSGFWSWTMMYHFSKHDTREMKTKADVIQEAKYIANYVNFIHQEKIDEDAQNILNLPLQKGKRINTSPRPSHQVFNEGMKSAVKKLDGEVAYILGGYF
jgi:hypothetical protein